MLLQSHQSYDAVAEFSPTSGSLKAISRRSNPVVSASPICGMFDYLGDRLFILYRDGENLMLQVDTEQLRFSECDFELLVTNSLRTLRVVNNSKILCECVYSPSTPDIDTTAFAEDEDYDFGLFLKNVSRSTPRQSRMLR